MRWRACASAWSAPCATDEPSRASPVTHCGLTRMTMTRVRRLSNGSAHGSRRHHSSRNEGAAWSERCARTRKTASSAPWASSVRGWSSRARCASSGTCACAPRHVRTVRGCPQASGAEQLPGVSSLEAHTAPSALPRHSHELGLCYMAGRPRLNGTTSGSARVRRDRRTCTCLTSGLLQRRVANGIHKGSSQREFRVAATATSQLDA